MASANHSPASADQRPRQQNPDLARERRSPPFDVEEMINYMDGGAEQTALKRDVWRRVLEDPELRQTERTEYMSHADKYSYNLRRGLAVLQLISAEGMDVDQISRVMSHTVSGFTTPDGNPVSVHQVMFMPTLMGMADDAQADRWLGDAYNGRIIGTYAQTELGHGTFVRGLQTTATYDPATRCFDLHTPHPSAAKWWPGGLGTAANHAVVMARLYTRGVCRGIHPLMVQIRHLDTHQPLPGITVGEIGPKLGQNTLNNGYLMFDHVSVPLENMLMRNARVEPDGTYTEPPHTKLGYGTMVFTRVSIARDTVDALQIAATIAARYSVVRRQGQPGPSGEEPQIIDFQTQQQKVLPQIAACYVLRAAATRLWHTHTAVTSQMRAGDMALLPELHASACCLKAFVTSEAAAGIETLRLACGGHGYMTASRFPALYAYATAGATYEGENTVLLLQTARYLVKRLNSSRGSSAAAAAAAPHSSISYLLRSDGGAGGAGGGVRPEAALLAAVARRRLSDVAGRLGQLTQRLGADAAWNSCLVDLAETALAHCRCYVLQSYLDSVAEQHSSRSQRRALLLLGQLYAAHQLSRVEGDLVTYGGATADDVRDNRRRLQRLLAEVRPLMIPLTDAFDLPDPLIGSTLGGWHGDVYRTMFEEAQRSPMNAPPPVTPPAPVRARL